MPRRLNLAGKRFGQLTVVAHWGRHGHSAVWVCRCDCGKHTKVDTQNLRSGHTKSCGCLKRAVAAKNLGTMLGVVTHGMSRSPQYRWWGGILSRCLNTKHDNYSDYGGRGIKVDPRWLGPGGFEIFYKDLLTLGPRPLGHTLDRINNDGNYVIGNLRWASAKIQKQNQRKRARLEEFTDEELRSEFIRRGL